MIGAVARTTGWLALPEAHARLRPPPSLDFGSAEELLRLEQALLEEDFRRYARAREHARSGATVLADTGFLGPLTYTAGLVTLGRAPARVLDSLVASARSVGGRGAWGFADAYIYLETAAAVRSRRTLADPGAHPAGLAARHEQVGELEQEWYRTAFAPRFGGRFRWVRGDDPVSDVAEQVIAAVGAFAAVPPTPPSIDSVLALFEGGAPRRGNR